jgi:hypothetical protein
MRKGVFLFSVALSKVRREGWGVIGRAPSYLSICIAYNHLYLNNYTTGWVGVVVGRGAVITFNISELPGVGGWVAGGLHFFDIE